MRWAWTSIGLLIVLGAAGARAQTPNDPNATAQGEPSNFWSRDDGWLDVSGFLKERYGFLPIVVPITEPAVGYGAAVGGLFLSKSLEQARQDGLGRPSITAVAGFGTQNGTYGGMVGDSRYWLDDHLQTLAAAMYASVNLDFHGIGRDPDLQNHPLDYNLRPIGGLAQAKYRFGDSLLWAGLGYVYAATHVRFDKPAGTAGIPGFETDSNVGGLTPSLIYDTRDNLFTPIRGWYLEASGGIFAKALGADDDFQRARLAALKFVPLSPTWFLGVRAEADASFGDTPFYLRPYISLRGAPALRFQGEQAAEIEAELRWQFWNRFSLVGFVGGGAAWNNFQHFNETQTIVTGGGGFRYEIAREFGIHMGLDLGFGPHTTAIYVQIGSAWARP